MAKQGRKKNKGSFFFFQLYAQLCRISNRSWHINILTKLKFTGFSNFLHSRLPLLLKMHRQSNLLPRIPAMWPRCKWTNHSVAHRGPTPLTKGITLAQEVNWSFCIHMDFTLWLTDFVTQKLDSLWQPVKLAVIHFLYVLLPYSRLWGVLLWPFLVVKSGVATWNKQLYSCSQVPNSPHVQVSDCSRRSEFQKEIYTGRTHRERTQAYEINN